MHALATIKLMLSTLLLFTTSTLAATIPSAKSKWKPYNLGFFMTPHCIGPIQFFGATDNAPSAFEDPCIPIAAVNGFNPASARSVYVNNPGYTVSFYSKYGCAEQSLVYTLIEPLNMTWGLTPEAKEGHCDTAVKGTSLEPVDREGGYLYYKIKTKS